MDIFISYATEDRAVAHRLAQVLESRGWSVWWDHHIRAGESFDSVIERELDSAGCVVVLWSARSTASEWVRNEAAAGAEACVLIPVLIEPVKPPLEFRRRQNVDLVGWNPDQGHDEKLTGLFDAIAATLVKDGAAPQRIDGPAPADPGKPPRRWFGGTVMMAVALLAAALLGWGAGELQRLEDRAAPTSAAPDPVPDANDPAPLRAGVLQFDWPGSDCWTVYRREKSAGGSCGAKKLTLQSGDYVVKSTRNAFEPISLRVEADQVTLVDGNAGFFDFKWPGSDCWTVYRGEETAGGSCGAKKLTLQAGAYVVKSTGNAFEPTAFQIRHQQTTTLP